MLAWYEGNLAWGIKTAKTISIAILASIFLFGINPYVSNTVVQKNPFYPAIRKGGKDVLQGLVHADFMKKNRFSKTVISVFSKGDRSKPPLPVGYVPFVHQKYWPDGTIRYSGNGPLFGFAVLMTLLFLFFLKPSSFILIGIVLSTVFVTSAGWYARLVPQLWWYPLIVFGIVAPIRNQFSATQLLIKKIIIYAVSGVLFFNCWIVGRNVYKKQYTETNFAQIMMIKHPDAKFIHDTNRFAQRFLFYASELMAENHFMPNLVKECPSGRHFKIAGFYGYRICGVLEDYGLWRY
ncbi:MAG: hypothetical protein KDK51_00390 [Deltaproteobacteria bacterium]|nr:hypothetical protein [Deltaproteobacteria bacterium]